MGNIIQYIMVKMILNRWRVILTLGHWLLFSLKSPCEITQLLPVLSVNDDNIQVSID